MKKALSLLLSLFTVLTLIAIPVGAADASTAISIPLNSLAAEPGWTGVPMGATISLTTVTFGGKDNVVEVTPISNNASQPGCNYMTVKPGADGMTGVTAETMETLTIHYYYAANEQTQAASHLGIYASTTAGGTKILQSNEALELNKWATITFDVYNAASAWGTWSGNCNFLDIFVIGDTTEMATNQEKFYISEIVADKAATKNDLTQFPVTPFRAKVINTEKYPTASIDLVKAVHAHGKMGLTKVAAKAGGGYVGMQWTDNAGASYATTRYIVIEYYYEVPEGKTALATEMTGMAGKVKYTSDPLVTNQWATTVIDLGTGEAEPGNVNELKVYPFGSNTANKVAENGDVIYFSKITYQNTIPTGYTPATPPATPGGDSGNNQGGNDQGGNNQGGNNQGGNNQGGNNQGTNNQGGTTTETQAPTNNTPVTNAPETNAPTTNTPADTTSGCASTVAGSAAIVGVIMAGIGFTMRKKRED